VQRKKAIIISWVFHRNGRRLKGFAKSWRKACRAAGIPGRIFHDTRRTAVRTFQRAGADRDGDGTRRAPDDERLQPDEVTLREGVAKLAAYEEGKVRATTEAAAL
jgi:hypothetical protein